MRLRAPERTETNSQSDGWNREAAHDAAREAAREAAIDRRRAETADEVADRDAMRREGAGAVGQAVPAVAAGGWQDIKSRFVDDPAGAVAAAEDMVRRVLEERIRALRSEAAAACGPERGPDGGESEPSTESMRSRLLRCQAYCEQLAASMAH